MKERKKWQIITNSKNKQKYKALNDNIEKMKINLYQKKKIPQNRTTRGQSNSIHNSGNKIKFVFQKEKRKIEYIASISSSSKLLTAHTQTHTHIKTSSSICFNTKHKVTSFLFIFIYFFINSHQLYTLRSSFILCHGYNMFLL